MSQTEQQPSLTTVYAGWDVYQQRFIEAFAPLTAEQLALRNAPESRGSTGSDCNDGFSDRGSRVETAARCW